MPEGCARRTPFSPPYTRGIGLPSLLVSEARGGIQGAQALSPARLISISNRDAGMQRGIRFDTGGKSQPCKIDRVAKLPPESYLPGIGPGEPEDSAPVSASAASRPS